MENMVLGFIFNDKMDMVLLIRKKRPKWQAGFLNGIGGHLEPKEQSGTYDWSGAFIREVKEECGLEIQKGAPVWLGRMMGHSKDNPWLVVLFAYQIQNVNELVSISQKTDEELEWMPVFGFDPKKVITNLVVLIPYAWYRLKQSKLGRANITLEYD